MGKGRKALPDAIQQLKGNPAKRKLHLEQAANGMAHSGPEPLPAPLAIPEFLTFERERQIFKRVVEDYLQRRIARTPDLAAFGRWAVYLHRWISAKESMDNRASWYKVAGSDVLRRHPYVKDMIDLERLLQSLEDRLGLNPVARQNIIKGLSTMPAALGGFFAGNDGEGKPSGGEEIEGETVAGPLGFLQNAGKTH